jgi:peptide deformylase
MEILAHPNPALKQTALPVDPAADRQLGRLVKQMAKLMYAAPGIGLAATQLGVLKRVIAYDLGDDRQPVGFCNPVIVEASEATQTEEEGCLSLPGITVPIERALSVVCEGLDLAGRPVRVEATDLFARLLQHEIDHLDGVLIIDRAAPEERKAAIKRYFEYERAEKL